MDYAYISALAKYVPLQSAYGFSLSLADTVCKPLSVLFRPFIGSFGRCRTQFDGKNKSLYQEISSDLQNFVISCKS